MLLLTGIYTNSTIKRTCFFFSNNYIGRILGYIFVSNIKAFLGKLFSLGLYAGTISFFKNQKCISVLSAWSGGDETTKTSGFYSHALTLDVFPRRPR